MEGGGDGWKKSFAYNIKYNTAWLQEQAAGSVKPGSVWSGWYDELLFVKTLFTLTIKTLEVIELYST